MGQLVVRKIEDIVKSRLQRRAQRHGHSMEEEVRDILRNATSHDEELSTVGLGTEIASLFSGIGLRSQIAELRGHKIKRPSFK